MILYWLDHVRLFLFLSSCTPLGILFQAKPNRNTIVSLNAEMTGMCQEQWHKGYYIIACHCIDDIVHFTTGWWFGTFFISLYIVGISSSHLTSIFLRWVGIPPTKSYTSLAIWCVFSCPVPTGTGSQLQSVAVICVRSCCTLEYVGITE